MGFTQPVCDRCWGLKNPGREACKVKEQHRDEETCCYCGNVHSSGIYTRVDPKSVPYPSANA